MNLRSASHIVLDQMLFVLDQIKKEDYSRIIPSLSASVGQHVRHILEFYICLFDGIQSGTVNYDQRNRDSHIENDKVYAINLISEIKEKINIVVENVEITLSIRYGEISDSSIDIETNFKRELAYNIEHSIHHLAIIKSVFREKYDYVSLPDNFGIASSTVRYMKENQS